MVTRHGAKKFIKAVFPEIERLIEEGYTIKEIHEKLPSLSDNISYSATLRNLQKMDIAEKTSHPKKINEPNINSNKNPTFSYDHRAKNKDLI